MQDWYAPSQLIYVEACQIGGGGPFPREPHFSPHLDQANMKRFSKGRTLNPLLNVTVIMPTYLTDVI